MNSRQNCVKIQNDAPLTHPLCRNEIELQARTAKTDDQNTTFFSTFALKVSNVQGRDYSNYLIRINCLVTIIPSRIKCYYW